MLIHLPPAAKEVKIGSNVNADEKIKNHASIELKARVPAVRLQHQCLSHYLEKVKQIIRGRMPGHQARSEAKKPYQ